MQKKRKEKFVVFPKIYIKKEGKINKNFRVNLLLQHSCNFTMNKVKKKKNRVHYIYNIKVRKFS